MHATAPDAGVGRRLQHIFRALHRAYGPQHWWPAQGVFEMMVGAILTQSAAWKNVELAIANLKSAQALTPPGLRSLPDRELARLVRPSGYFNSKARKLKALAEHLSNYADDVDAFLGRDVHTLRQELLSVYGVGPETADSIILYGADKPQFVVDAYTQRIFERIGLRPSGDTYPAWQGWFMDHLPADASLFNEYHALLVAHGKRTCRRVPACEGCPLRADCDFGRRRLKGD